MTNSKKVPKKVVQQATKKMMAHPEFLKENRDDLRDLLGMLKESATREYSFPTKSLIMSLSAVIYFVNPFDLVPDFIIGAGLLDDATVLAMAIKAIKGDIEKYRNSKSNKTDQNK